MKVRIQKEEYERLLSAEKVCEVVRSDLGAYGKLKNKNEICKRINKWIDLKYFNGVHN